jgi:TonB-linked SusC/RagA family outer membrane protein
MKKLYTLIFYLFFISALSAQVTVTGKVVDTELNEPVIGATIREKDTENGTATDLEGNFSLDVASPNAVLVVSYTGFAEQEVLLDGRTQVEIQLSQDEALLNEVVVVGYGTQRKSDLTGSVGSVKSKDVERVATSSLENALQGRIAGVYVAPSSGEPGVASIIRVRGTGTLNNASPIFVIDGMITSDASFVNPQDVESVEVLKDASATAIYGSRGANGVILITTKSGRNRKEAIISLNTYYGQQNITRTIDMANAAEFAQLYNEYRGTNYFPDPASLGEGTDWQEEIYRQAPIGSVQLSANGGSEGFSYNISGNYFDQTGIVENSAFQRYTVRFNGESRIKPWLTLGNNLSYAHRRISFPPNVVPSALRMPPVLAPRDSTGDFTDPTSPYGLPVANPAADLFYKSNNRIRDNRFLGTIYGDVKLFEYFTFRSNFGFDLEFNRGRFFEPIFNVSASQLNKEDKLGVGAFDKRDWIWEQTLTFSNEWNRHRLNVLAGYTAEERSRLEFSAGRRNFPGMSPEILYLGAGNDTTQTNAEGAVDEAQNSWLFRTNYTFNDRYLLTVSARIDNASRFAEENRSSLFPSVGVGWNAGQEAFVERTGLFDRLKLRASYGILGNQNSASQYPSLGVVSTGLYAIFGTTENLNQGASLTQLGNPDLRWETTEQVDFGLEIGLLRNRFSAEIDWYNRRTYDIIAAVPIPDYVGAGNDPIVNTAEVRNTGWEFTLNWRDGDKFVYSLGAILSPVENEVIKINERRAQILAGEIQGEFVTRSIPGLPIGSFYGYQVAGVFQNAEELSSLPRLGNEGIGDLRYQDLNGDGVITGADRTYLGSPIPTLTYAFNAAFEWAGLDFAFDFFGVSGNKIVNAKKTFRFAEYNWERSFYEGRWTPENPSTTKPRITNGGTNYRISDYFVEDGSFLRLRTVALGYTFPRAWLERASISRLRLYVSGLNLWTQQEYSGYSPEFPNNRVFEEGIDFGSYPVAKSYQVGIDATF